MSGKSKALSQDTFDRVLARAVELDEQGSTRLSAVRAREIALDVGVSPAAWDEAVSEDAARQRVRRSKENGVNALGWHQLLIVTASLGLGISTGARYESPFVAEGMVGVATAGLIAAVALALLGINTVRRSWSRLHVDLPLWWLPFPVGFSLGLGRLFDDPFAFAIFGWLGSAAIGGLIAYRLDAHEARDVDRNADRLTA